MDNPRGGWKARLDLAMKPRFAGEPAGCGDPAQPAIRTRRAGSATGTEPTLQAENPVKNHIVSFVAAVAVLAALGLIYVTSDSLQSPQVKLSKQIDEEVEKAQRMLDAYDPTGARFLQALEVEDEGSLELLPENEWSDHIQYRPFRERIAGQAQALQRLRNEARELGDERSPGTGTMSFEAFRQDLQANQDLIGKALQVVQAAIRTSAEGDATVSGRSHPAAARLEAILLYEKADLLRRAALVEQIKADDKRAAVNRLRRRWHDFQVQAAVLKPDLPDAEGADGADADGAEGAVPDLAMQLEDLRSQRGSIEDQIEEARAESTRLSDEVAELEKRYAEQQEAANKAQLRMIELRNTQDDDGDALALERFKTEYNAASKNYREASREMARLAGGIAPLPPQETGEEETAEEPLDAEKPAIGLLPEARNALQAARQRVEKLEATLQTIEVQIEQVTERRKSLRQRHDEIASAQEQLLEKMVAAGREAVRLAVQADALATEALQIVNEEGEAKRAARNAQAARAKWSSDAQSQRVAGSPNERLELIAGSTFLGGHVETLEADVDHLHAMILAQQVRHLRRHETMLRRLSDVGVDTSDALDIEVPQGQALDPHWLDADEAATQATSLLQKATEIAAAAEELYQEAERKLNGLWLVHARRGALQYLLANLLEGPEAEEAREEAIDMYRRAVEERADQPAAEPFVEAAEKLSANAP